MLTVAEIVISNAAAATIIAIVAAFISRRRTMAPLGYALWLLVFIKLVTPPLYRVPISLMALEVPRVEATAQARSSQFGQPFTGPDQELTPHANPDLASASWHWSLPTSDQYPKERTTHADTQTAPAIQFAQRDMETPAVQPSTGESIRRRTVRAVDPEPGDVSIPWNTVVVGIWALGGVLWYCLVAVRVVRFRRRSVPMQRTDRGLQQHADELARKMGLRRSPPIKIVNAVVPPMLCAAGKPVEILLPARLIERLSADQRSSLLAHELAHYRRYDHWVRWFEVAVLGLYWWHPVAWIARSQLHRAEEQCCDAWVLWTLPGHGGAYARAILQTVDFLSGNDCPAPTLAAGLSPVRLLERRIEMILQANPVRRLSPPALWSLLLLSLLVLPVAGRAQLTPPAAPVAPTVESAPAAAPAVEAVSAGEPSVDAASSAAPSVEAAPPSALARDYLNAVPGELAPQAVVSTTPSNPADGDAFERRLQRLEKMVEKILVQRQDRRDSNALSQAQAPAGGLTFAYTNFRAIRDSQSLADLKKLRIDIEEEMANLQDRLHDLDSQITKLESERTGKRTPLRSSTK